MIPQNVINLGHQAVKHYEQCLANGCTEKFAEMVTLGQAPVYKGSDREVLTTAKRRKLQLEGQINSTPPVKAKRKNKEISKRALRELTRQERKENPGLTQKAAEEQVKDKYIPKWKRRRK